MSDRTATEIMLKNGATVGEVLDAKDKELAALKRENEELRAEAAAAWDKCEERRIENEELRKAVEVAINHYADVGSEHWNLFDRALSNAHAMLKAKQESAEPFAWLDPDPLCYDGCKFTMKPTKWQKENHIPVYTTPTASIYDFRRRVVNLCMKFSHREDDMGSIIAQAIESLPLIEV